MIRRWPGSAALIVLATVTILLSADLIVLNAVILPAMQGVLVAAFRGAALPLVNVVFQRIATDAPRIPLWVYQYKLAYAYEAMKVPALVLCAGMTVLVWLSTRPREARLAIRSWPQRFAYLVLWSLLLALLAYGRLGTYSRFMADDYCSAADLREMGFVGANVHSYLTFSDRYAATFLDGIASALGPHLASFAAPVVIMAWIVSIAFALSQFPLAGGRSARLYVNALLSAAMVFCALQLALHLEQSLYWGQGMHSVLPPLVFSAICVGMFRHRLAYLQASSREWLWWLSAVAVSFASSGFSETYSAMQVTVWTMLALAAVVGDKSRFRSKLLSQGAPFLAGSFAGLAFMAVSPANAARLGAGPHPGPLTVVAIAARSTLDFLEWVVFSWQRGLTLLALMLLFALVTGGFFFRDKSPEVRTPPTKRAVVLLPVVTLVALLSSFTPAAYALGGPPPGRAQIIPGFVLVCAVASWGAIVGQLARGPNRRSEVGARPPLRQVALLVLVLFILTTGEAAWARSRQLPAFAQYTSLWDANEARIRSAVAQGSDHVVVTRIISNWADMPDRELGGDATAWINACASRYYGIEVTAE